MISIAPGLYAKYNRPSPRYTCYPGVAHWEDPPSEDQWIRHLDASLEANATLRGIALYVHIPFCQALCTFCGCNIRVARNHSLATPYVPRLIRELDLYRERLGRSGFSLGSLHLGGGTPTFLPVEELQRLLSGMMERAQIQPDAVLTVEVDPRVTTREHLVVLRRHGFNRVSIGVQDFDPRVLDIVNRPQEESQVREIFDTARGLGFSSISVDLIYGLPLQTTDSIEVTMDALERLQPDQISFYPYAPVPWIKPSQRRFTEADLPERDVRQGLLATGRHRMQAAGFAEIGLDQYALGQDPLVLAATRGTLSRNFMGYSASLSMPLIGLGSSALGDAGTALAQNEKNLMRYEARVDRGELPIQRGHVLDAQDLQLRRIISDIVTRFATRWSASDQRTEWFGLAATSLAELQQDGLIELGQEGLRVTQRGRPFLRNICMAFDARSRLTLGPLCN
ncbi:MAG: oxygen-independent coproporphyrinogen III oxidase [Pseudomonadota bacterium]